MNHIRLLLLALVATLMAIPKGVVADEGDKATDERIERVMKAGGGHDMLLDVFRFRERILITSKPAPPVTKNERGNRTSVVKAGGGWWIGTKKRNKDKVRVLCWAWSLRILLDDNVKIEAIPDIVFGKKPAFGLRVTEAVKEPIDMYFDSESHRLSAIDYTNTRHIFSDWRKTDDGHVYPAHVAGFRFADRKAGTLKKTQWYQTDILELVPLTQLPSELK